MQIFVFLHNVVQNIVMRYKKKDQKTKKSLKYIDKRRLLCYTTKKMIEAHLKKSIFRGKACAGVAKKKGFGAEGLPLRMGILATRRISVLLSPLGGVLSELFVFSGTEGSRGSGCFLLKVTRRNTAAEIAHLCHFCCK
ncbi:MAG: hypothetical protein IJY39_00540 [Clostridia bacterium]|nr:hypothetical protein [Clostridia bacterium]